MDIVFGCAGLTDGRGRQMTSICSLSHNRSTISFSLTASLSEVVISLLKMLKWSSVCQHSKRLLPRVDVKCSSYAVISSNVLCLRNKLDGRDRVYIVSMYFRRCGCPSTSYESNVQICMSRITCDMNMICGLYKAAADVYRQYHMYEIKLYLNLDL